MRNKSDVKLEVTWRHVRLRMESKMQEGYVLITSLCKQSLICWIWFEAGGEEVDPAGHQRYCVRFGVHTTLPGQLPVLWRAGERRDHYYLPHHHFHRRRRFHLRNRRAAEACHCVETDSQCRCWWNRGRVLLLSRFVVVVVWWLCSW